MQADQKVGFGDAIRHEIETRICVEEGDCVGFNCFETAEQQALTTLNSVFFPAFRASTGRFGGNSTKMNSLKRNTTAQEETAQKKIIQNEHVQKSPKNSEKDEA